MDGHSGTHTDTYLELFVWYRPNFPMWYHVPNIPIVFPWLIPNPFDSPQISATDCFCVSSTQKRMYTLGFVDIEPICQRHVSKIGPIEQQQQQQREFHQYTISINKLIDRSHSASTYFNPRHVVLLHFLHFLFDAIVQFVFEFQRLHVIHVAVVVVEISENEHQYFNSIDEFSFGFYFLGSFLDHLPGKRRP